MNCDQDLCIKISEYCYKDNLSLRLPQLNSNRFVLTLLLSPSNKLLEILDTVEWKF